MLNPFRRKCFPVGHEKALIEYLSASQTQEGIDEEAISNEIGPIGPSDLPIDLSSPISSQCYGLPELTEKRYIIIVLAFVQLVNG